MGTAIVAEGLVKRFGQVKALDGVDLVVDEGKVLGLLGPNGAGKTTAVRILTTLLTPDGGRATVGGFDVVRDASQLRRVIGLTGQYAAVDELLSGLENLMMIGRLLGLDRKAARTRAEELLGTFDLADAAGKIAKTYSGGMRRRLDLAASLVGRPQLLFLDEPTTGLDPRGRRQLWDLIADLVSQRTTVLLTTQYLEEADHLADEIAVMDHGRVVAHGTADQLKARVGGEVIEVNVAGEADLDNTAQIVASFFGSDLTIDRETQLVSAPVKDPALVGAAISKLHAEGIELSQLSVRRPSLDEVFLALTGHPAEDQDQTQDGEAR